MNILFVCTGNTCRSPMAAYMARALGFDAHSAGLFAGEAQGISPYAERALEKRGIDASGHQAQPVSERLMKQADRVVGITAAHAERLRQRYPQYAGKIISFVPDIPDPFGQSEATYEKTAQQIERGLQGMKF